MDTEPPNHTLDASPDLPVNAVRVTFFPGRLIPWVEIWQRREGHDDIPTYPYLDLFRPSCPTDAEWVALLATGTSTVFQPVPPARRCASERLFGPCTQRCEQPAAHDGPHRAQCFTWDDSEEIPPPAVAAHVMVIPGYGPAMIGDGPAVETFNTDQADHIRVNGIPQYMPHPHPDPTPIHGTPYEAYALGHWALNVFAIRLREQP